MKSSTGIFCYCCVLCFIMWMPFFDLKAQDTAAYEPPEKGTAKSSFLAGTQIPLQFTAGYEYRFNDRLSARAQAGFVSKPYSGFIVDAMEAFGMDRYLSQVIRKSFQNGTILGLGPNFHFGKNYLGVYGQYMHLKAGGITPADALSIYFQKDFSQFDMSALPVFEFAMQSNILNAGILFGHRFQLRNPRFSVHTEAGISKLLTSKNRFSSNRPVVDRTSFASNLYKELDSQMQEAYWKHGFIPTINLYLVYGL